MFKIESSQLAAFANAALRDFENRMVSHLRRVLPDRCGDDEKIRRTIQTGMERAARYGIELEYDICLYLHVMLVLGERFDEEPAFSWARELLDNKDWSTSSRVNRLHDMIFNPQEEMED